MKKMFLSTIVAILLVAVGASAQESAGISPEKIALVKELIEVTGSKEQSIKMMDTMMAFQDVQTRSMIATMFDDDKDMTPADRAMAKELATQSAERAIASVQEFFRSEVDLVQMMETIVIPIYSKHFTESELRDMISFYRTPTGQKMIRTMTDVVVESMGIMSEQLMPKLQIFMKKAVEQESTKIKREISKTKPSSKM